MPAIVGATYIPNPLGIAELSLSVQVTAGCMAMAAAVAEVAKRLTPVRQFPKEGPEDNSADPGELRKSIMTVPGTSLDNAVTAAWLHAAPESGARAVAMDWRFHWVEFGTMERESDFGQYRGQMSPYAPFRKAAEATGRYIPNASEQKVEAPSPRQEL